MAIAALTWPQASIYVALIVTVGVVVAVLIWSIFRTGRAAMGSASGHRHLIESLRTDVGELRAQVQGTNPPNRAADASSADPQ